MWRHILMVVGLLVLVLGGACSSFDNTPKRLSAYLTPVPVSKGTTVAKVPLPTTKISAALVVINDHGFQKSAPALQPGTLQDLGKNLQSVLEKQVPIQLVTVVYPEALQPTGSSDQFVSLAKEHGVPIFSWPFIQFGIGSFRSLSPGRIPARWRGPWLVSGVSGRKLCQIGIGPA